MVVRARWAIAIFVGLVAMASSAATASAADSLTPLCNGQACDSGWYTGPVFLSWSWTGGTATSGCSSQDYQTDTSGASNACTVLFSDGSISREYVLKVEVSSPTATATPARPPDSNGWYNHPVAVSFAGSAFSGIASCSPATAYSGPSAVNAALSGTCTDNAGKTATADVSLNYDDTPPTITGVSAARKPDVAGYYTHPVKFTFSGTDAASGIASCQTVTYRGPSSGTVLGGCWDRAGNYASISVPVRYRLAAPRASVAHVGLGLVLHWKRAAKASYYNVQIYRGKKKVLSTWPAHTSLLLRRSWSFGGHRFRLKAGRYRWYVWPGYGSRAAARYGRALVSSSFRVAKRA